MTPGDIATNHDIIIIATTMDGTQNQGDTTITVQIATTGTMVTEEKEILLESMNCMNFTESSERLRQMDLT